MRQPQIMLSRFFVFALLGSDYDGFPYTQSGDLIAELAMRGIRLVIEEFRTDVTKTKKDGTRGVLRIDYGTPKQPEPAIKWLWKFIDGAKTAGELYGRALVVIAAEQHACRLALPSSQRFGAKRWPSHKDHAAKALAKLAGPHLPASLKQLEKAVAKASRELHDAQAAAYATSRQRASGAGQTAEEIEAPAIGEEPDDNEEELDVDEDLDELAEDDLDHDDVAGAIGPAAAVHSDADPGL